MESDKETGHQKRITSLSKSADGSHFLTSSRTKFKPSFYVFSSFSSALGYDNTDSFEDLCGKCSSERMRDISPSQLCAFSTHCMYLLNVCLGGWTC